MTLATEFTFRGQTIGETTTYVVSGVTMDFNTLKKYISLKINFLAYSKPFSITC